MVESIWQQATLVFKKNLLIYIKEKQFIYEMIAPLFCFVLLMTAKNSTSFTLKVFAVEFLPMSLLVTTRYMVTSLIAEKSDRQKEIQKIMGLRSMAYTLGWLLSNLSRLFSVCLFFLILTIPSGCFDALDTKLSVGGQIGSYLLYALALMALSYFISTLFDVPRSGAELSIFLNILGSVCSEFMSIKYFEKNNWIVFFLSLIPSFCYNTIPYFEITSVNSDQNQIQFTSTDYLSMLGFDIILYSLLFIYLEQVLPNDYGTNKHPLFFLGFKYDTIINEQQQGNQNIDLNQPFLLQGQMNQFQDYSSAYYHEPFENTKQVKRAVFIANLQKNYQNKIAVDSVTLSIYESQILCLLGHNGAGKTTLISLMTGLIKKNQGSILYYGQSTDEHLDEIRTFIGICPQKDVIYDSMTVDEHLQYYGRIKGMNMEELPQEIDSVVNQCALLGERSKLAKNLSGGNKRKLSLAMALIGRSKVIFLDEPTSGMDPVSRRKIWEILLKMKNSGKCLVLTTHHLDEAEILSERLAIMAKGKLLTVGSVDFIKLNFGIGYHLNIDNCGNSSEEWNIKSQKIVDLVLNSIPQSQMGNNQNGGDQISLQLPFNRKEYFLKLFKQLESDPTIQINLLMNTLEEAFINIGMDEEQFIKRARGNSGIIEAPVVQDIKITDEFAKIIIPECLALGPKYSFWNQFYACILRKQYGMQGKRLIVQLIVPAVFVILGPILTLFAYSIFPNKSTQLQASLGLLDCYGYIIFGISIASSQIGGIPVQERELKQKYALNVMGCRMLPYWLSNYAYDLIICVSLLIFFLIAVYASAQKPLQIFDVFALVFLLYFAYVPLSYLLSWLFTTYLSAIRAIIIIQIFVFYLTAYLLYYFLRDYHALIWILTLIFPSISFLGGFNAIFVSKYYKQNKLHPNNTNTPNPISDHPWVFMIILLLQAFMYFVFTLIIDSRAQLAANIQNQIIQSKDDDVLREAERVSSPSCTDKVIAKQISKTYANGFYALKGTSFGVEPGTIFGLLGPNGAGKSTTFNMITSRLKPSTGQILLEGTEIKKGMGEVYQNVGICPQFDSLFETLTPIQHLTIWAYLKGLSGKDVVESVNYFMKVMQLTAFAATQAGQLSGGNKRKLCVALALMGGTNMQFFDEPSSGVDPIARRFLWNAIQQGVKLRQSAVILTTHTMDEAEGLCSKIAIQVNGQFACMGTPQHLKQKFGEGYRLNVELIETDSKDALIKVLSEHFKDIKLVDDYNSPYKLVFKLQKNGFRFYEAFSFLLETVQNDLKLIKDFQINQSNLEQVFFYFASFQEQQQEEDKKVQQKQCFAGCCGYDED